MQYNTSLMNQGWSVIDIYAFGRYIFSSEATYIVFKADILTSSCIFLGIKPMIFSLPSVECC